MRRVSLWILALLVATAPACASVTVGEGGVTGSGPAPAFRAGRAERLVVISAVEQELELLLAQADVQERVEIAGRTHHVGRLRGHPVVLFLGGVSLVNAAMAAQAVIDHFPVTGIVFSGIAGGVSPDLAIGDVVVPARWGQFQEMVFAKETPEGWDTSGRAGQFPNFGMMFPRGQLVPPEHADPASERRRFWFPTDEGMLETARRVAGDLTLERCGPSGDCLEHQPRIVVGGNGVSGSVFVNNAGFREYLWDTFAAEAVDMESAAIAQVAFVNGVPFLAFRSLSDLAGGGPGANEIDAFGQVAADNSAAVLLDFLRLWQPR